MSGGVVRHDFVEELHHYRQRTQQYELLPVWQAVMRYNAPMRLISLQSGSNGNSTSRPMASSYSSTPESAPAKSRSGSPSMAGMWPPSMRSSSPMTMLTMPGGNVIVESTPRHTMPTMEWCSSLTRAEKEPRRTLPGSFHFGLVAFLCDKLPKLTAGVATRVPVGHNELNARIVVVGKIDAAI